LYLSGCGTSSDNVTVPPTPAINNNFPVNIDGNGINIPSSIPTPKPPTMPPTPSIPGLGRQLSSESEKSNDVHV